MSPGPCDRADRTVDDQIPRTLHGLGAVTAGRCGPHAASKGHRSRPDSPGEDWSQDV